MQAQKKAPNLNSVYCWIKMKHDELDIRIHQKYNYIDRGTIVNSGENQVFRYVKNYGKGSKKFSLIINTMENDTKKIEKFLDKTAKTIVKIPAHTTDLYEVGAKYEPAG